MSTERATWSYTYEKGLVDILKELANVPMFKGQNGWTAEGWRNITNKFNDMFPTTHFTKQQVQEKEKELKGNYKHDTLGMIIAEPKDWKKLIKVSELPAEPNPQASISEQSNHSMASIDRNPLSLGLGGVESTEVQSAPASRNSEDQDITGGKKYKQSQMAAKLGDYIDFRKDQIEKTLEKLEEEKRRDEDYSIEKCIDIMDAMEGLSDEQKADANEVFQSETNRKILVGTKNPSVRLI
ncbi:hypothetical protein SETIT_8G153300v2 [Setaria italica]|uniref:Myb/SANT-like domain-containing protein n=1 Tax=Setaria italica TaxID=4555 RepID=A0A368S8A3_SETIT|nr:hypothetical protein SETIT_8G153300v2 [Setaria italica]